MANSWTGRGLIAIVTAFASAQTAFAEGLDETVNNIVAPLAKQFSDIIFVGIPIGSTEVPIVVAWLVIGAVFCTFYFGMLTPANIKHSLKLVRGDFADPSAKGEISHFKALSTALSGTVGVGNIGAVAVLVSIGGPGAVFWMAVAGLLGMSVKFAECILGVKYRNEHADGSVSGGPMHYLSKGIAEHHSPIVGRFVGGLYAACMVIGCLGIGNMFQSNQAYAQFANVTAGTTNFMADKGWLFGIVLAFLVALVIIGGIRSIAKVTSRVVPTMAVLYLAFALVVIFVNAGKLPGVFIAIFTEAFSPHGLAGGGLAVIVLGFQRAVFSNEAGLGSASIAHSAVKTDKPATEGFVGLLEPLIDTVLICTITALVILVTVYDPAIHGYGSNSIEGIELTSSAFTSVISWFDVPLSIAVMLFAFSTMIAWAYYGLKGWTYFMGESTIAKNSFNLIFCIFVVLGCTLKLQAILDFSDAIVFAMAFPNILGLYLLAPTVKQELKSYMAEING